jgi:hypothetical protein
LTQIAGPADPPPPPRASDSIMQRLLAYTRLIWSEPAVLAYRLEDALPRVYAASRLEEVGSDDRETINKIRRCGLEGCVIMERLDGFFAQPLTVLSFHLNGDRIEVFLDAPAGGTVVANLPYTPFWSARTADRNIPLRPANLIQMAVAVPAGTRHVVLEYKRPLLLDRLRGVPAQ